MFSVENELREHVQLKVKSDVFNGLFQEVDNEIIKRGYKYNLLFCVSQIPEVPSRRASYTVEL